MKNAEPLFKLDNMMLLNIPLILKQQKFYFSVFFLTAITSEKIKLCRKGREAEQKKVGKKAEKLSISVRICTVRRPESMISSFAWQLHD